MAKVKSLGYTDTAIEGVSALNFPRGLLNFGANFRVKSVNAGKEIILTNITSPVDRPEKIRIAISEVANIYASTGVEPSVAAPTKKGVQILVQLTQVISVTDDTDPDYRVDLPVSYHTVVKVPYSEYITSADIFTGLGRLQSGFFDTGSLLGTRLEAILRGVLEPSDV